MLFCWCTPSFTLVLQCLRDPCLQVFPVQSYITITFMPSITTSISIIHNQILHAKNRCDGFIKEIWGQARIFNVTSSLHLRMEMMGSDPSLKWHQTSQECHGNFLNVLNTEFAQNVIFGLIVGFHLFRFPHTVVVNTRFDNITVRQVETVPLIFQVIIYLYSVIFEYFACV